MGRSGLLPHPAQVPSRRRRKFPWEEEGVTAPVYDDEGEWHEEAIADEDEPPAYQDEDEFPADASPYAALDSDDPSLANEAADYPDDLSDPSAEQEWADEPDQDDNAEERGLVPYHSGQTGSFTRQGGALVSFGETPYVLEPGALPPIFIAGERKTDKIGALGHTPIAPRAHRPRPFFFHTLTLAIMTVSLIISALTVGALSGGLLGNLANFPSMVGAAAPPPPPVKFHWYTVRLTDTVEGIAKTFHIKSGGILELNGLVDGEQIYTGMNLKVPSDPTYGANFYALMNIPYAPTFTPSGPYGSYVPVPGFNSFGVRDYAGDPYGGSFGECTWWAAHKRPDENLTGIGNAWTWADGARQRGYTVTSWPVPNATVVFQPGAEGALGAGHVAHVEQLLPGGWILVSEMNNGWNGGGWGRVDYRYITPGPGVMFIH